MIIDGHSHVHDPLDIHLSALDDAGVDRTVLFPTRPHPERATDLVSLRHEMSVLDRALAGGSAGGSGAAGDDGYAKAWQELDAALAAQPSRFLGFGAVPLGRTADETAAWVEREVVGRGLYGIGELTPPPDRAALVEPVLRAAADHRGLPVVVHGYAPTSAADLHTLTDLAARYPKVPLVISQLGGSHWMQAIELARTTPNVYLELSTAHLIFAVRLAIRELPARTLFGSDAPYGDPVVARTTVERVTRPGEVRERVLGGNLAVLLGLS
ncbi:metal-dependent hydrolase [Streptomyces albofaciens JCM 4342]|uniref:amidohydrolase family protein n=1 Tax=Streptomyces albofaciens TaxID=66866 RepID=UPI00123AC2FA|nr:amidohydrolase family protein [Streptomyces albofaciens]KAA6220742.1 metal-dependent hydrolase [Streptomyces albofaciens JCM 4342]